MTTVAQLTDFLETIAPLHLQESYDNAGLIVGRPGMVVRGVLTTLDCTEAVIAEAIEKDCNVIVAHHPIVFKGLKRFNEATYVERVVARAIKNDIALYAIHTNLDHVLHHGVNQRIAQRLGLQRCTVLSPIGINANTGAGLVGYFDTPVSWPNFLQLLHTAMRTQVVRHTGPVHDTLSCVAVCGGAGSFLLPVAKSVGAQALVSADFKYHEFFDAENQLIICDIGHFESEQFTADLLCELISEKFRNFAARLSTTPTNPVFYSFHPGG